MIIPASALNQLEHAIYLPAITRNYAEYAYEVSALYRSLPRGLSLDDLDVFNTNSKLFHLKAALYSAGHYSHFHSQKNNLVFNIDKSQVLRPTIMGDSGGHQIANGTLTLTQLKVQQIYEWLIQHSDVAMTLDVPPSYVNPIYGDFETCLKVSMDNLSEFISLGARNHHFLNVLQFGSDITQAEYWYDNVKGAGLYGWAFAGRKKYKLKYILWMLLRLINDGAFEKAHTWIHFLGIGDLKTAILLTAIRDALNWRFEHCHTVISYDTTSPMTEAVQRLSYYGSPQLSTKRATVPINRIDKATWIDSNEPFPCDFSMLGRVLTKGDIIQSKYNGDFWIDRLSWLMLQNHNLEVQLRSIDKVNQLFKLSVPEQHLGQLLPYSLIEARNVIFKVLMTKNTKQSLVELTKPKNLIALDNTYSPKLIDPSILASLDNVIHLHNHRL